MVEFTPDAPLIIASLIILTVLLASAVLWIRQVQLPRDLIQSDKGVSPWSIGWVNFGIFFCALIFMLSVAQSSAALFIPEPADSSTEIELTPQLALLSVLATQGPLILVFFIFRRFYPEVYADRLDQAQLTVFQAFKQAVPLFAMFLPVIWFASYIWSRILSGLQKINIVDEFAPQPLVTIFQDGGNISIILILIGMAVVVAPLVEEIIFRGCFYRFLKSQTPLFLAQIISGSFFALMHLNLMAFVPLVIVGVILARIYEKTGSLFVAIWFHAFFNAFSLSMLFITGMSDALPTDY